MIRIEELMRGSIIEYQCNKQSKDYGRWFKDIVWGISSDEDGRDFVEIGMNGLKGWISISNIKGIELTEDILFDYGFLLVNNLNSLVTFYRDDCGYVKLDTYGIQPLFREGEPIRYLHNFQRIFFDTHNKLLVPRVSEMPKVDVESKLKITKPKSAQELLDEIKILKNISSSSNPSNVSYDFD